MGSVGFKVCLGLLGFIRDSTRLLYGFTKVLGRTGAKFTDGCNFQGTGLSERCRSRFFFLV